MADEKKKSFAGSAVSAKKVKNVRAAKKEKAPGEKKPNAFVRTGRRGVKKFFRDVKGECKKVIWPDKKMVLKSTLIVLVSIAVVGAVIALIDLGLSQIVKALVALAKGSGAEAVKAVVGVFAADFFGS